MSRQDGFTLIELAVVLVIAGFIIGVAIAGMRPYLEYAQYNTTRMKMDNIADALALYAQNYNRLPCPADPNPTGPEPLGAPRGSGADGDEIDNDCGTPADHIGVVPWRALGLGREQVLDGFGNALTYAVSPVLAGESGGGSQDDVHELCRVENVWIDPTTLKNINPGKAKVCCPREIPGANAPIEIMDARTGGKSMFSGKQSDDDDDYDPYDTMYDNEDMATINLDNTIIAFTLVSHGKNGDGAYIIGTNNTMRITAPTDAEESENYNEDRTFVARERSTRNNNEFFDDVIIWRTNHQLFSAFGNNSCTRP